MTKRIINDFFESIYPNHGKLKRDVEGTLETIIIDGESDGLICKFNNDDCVEINTAGYTHITLSKNNLIHLNLLISKAEKIYEKDDD